MGDHGRVRQRVVVRGRVQGVAFRYATREQAERGRVAGWVRNRADGAVEAVFEGEPAAVARAVDWCRHGPALARVDDVEVRAEEPEGLAGFEIRL